MLDQLWSAAREKSLCTGNDIHWPNANTSWGGGTITSLTDNGNNSWTITDSTLGDLPSGQTDNGKYWSGSTRPTTLCTSAKYWVNVQCNEGSDGGLPYLNGSYDIIIEDFDLAGDCRDLKPWQVIRGAVTDNRNKSITASINLADHVTAGYLSGTSHLIGKKFYLIRSAGIWWGSKDFDRGRYPDFPNDPELWRGIADQGKVYSTGEGYLVETINKLPRDPYNQSSPPIAWTKDQFKDKEVLAYGGNLRRLTVTSNDAQVIYFGGLDHIPSAEEEAGGSSEYPDPLTTSYTFGGNYTVVSPGSKGFPGRVGFAPFWWYGGAQDTLWTHDPSDSFIGRALAFAADLVSWFELESLAGDCDCGDDCSRVTEYNPLDKDIVSSVTNFCDPAEHFYAPQLFKTLRGLQAYIEGIIGSFVRPDIDYSGSADIYNYSTAQCFADCGINSGAATVSKTAVTTTSGSTTVTNSTYFFSVSSTYFGLPIWYDVILGGKRRTQGNLTSDSTNGRIVVGTASTTNSTDLAAADALWLGASVVYSAGWTRYHPLEFTHLYESAAFVPDIEYPTDPLAGDPYPLYPPQVFDFCCLKDDPPAEVCCKDCFGVGQWIHRDPSSGFKTYDAYGYAINGGGNTFAVGDLVRYAGDMWHDPGTDQRRQINDDILDLPYWDRFGEFRHPHTVHQQLVASRAGAITASTKNSITDTTQNWWANWYSGGTGKVHSGVAVSGSSTTMTISGDYADTTKDLNCWLQASRFIGDRWTANGPFTDFILEVDKITTVASVTTTTTYKMPISSLTAFAPDVGNQPVIHFDAQDGFTVAAGDQWRIREPGTNLNRLRTRRVVVTKPDGSTVELDVTHNDDTTLFFEAQSAVFPANTTYQVVEYTPGGVWQFATAKPTDGRAWQKIGEGKYWVQPVGADARGKPFHPNQTENLPHKALKQYGHVLKGDYIYFDTFSELYLMLNRLRWTLGSAGWTSRANPAVAELNVRSYSGPPMSYPGDTSQTGPPAYLPPGPTTDFASAVAKAWAFPSKLFAEYGGGSESDGAAPQFASTYHTEAQHDGGTVTSGQVRLSTDSVAAYVTTPVAAGMALMGCAVDVYAFAEITPGGGPHPEDSVPIVSQVPDPALDGYYHRCVVMTESKFDGRDIPLTFRKWGKIATLSRGAEAYGANIVGPKIGDVGAAADPPQAIEPVAPENPGGWPQFGHPGDSIADGYSGYAITATSAVRRWDVPGGLRYVA